MIYRDPDNDDEPYDDGEWDVGVDDEEICHNCGAAYDGGNCCSRCGCGDPTDSGEFCHGCGCGLTDDGECPSVLCDHNSCKAYIPS